jgi:hypothetical protein
MQTHLEVVEQSLRNMLFDVSWQKRVLQHNHLPRLGIRHQTLEERFAQIPQDRYPSETIALGSIPSSRRDEGRVEGPCFGFVLAG